MENWFCTECPAKTCEVRQFNAQKGFEEKNCPPDVEAVWRQPGQITEEQFRKWFWSAILDYPLCPDVEHFVGILKEK